MPIIETTNDGVKIFIKVVPNASRDELSGVVGDRLKVRVKSPPEGGKANKSACLLLSVALGLKVNSLAILQGKTNMHKTIEARGITLECAKTKLCME
jgi:uncharacterized protein